MAEIAPFRAWRYDPGRVDLARVVTQPYDKITPEMQERYYAADPHNFVRIILGKHEGGDGTANNVYTRSRTAFEGWRRDGILAQDSEPSIYPYNQTFRAPGGSSSLERKGFIALGRVEDYSANVVFRHEQTLAKPKADRLELLRATDAHLEQLFMLYSDPAGEIEELLRVAGAPAIDVKDEYEAQHQVWRLADPTKIEQICIAMRDKKLIIADGHHRYETALNYRNERRGARGGADAPFEFVMMTFINMESPGLAILPTHRVIHGLDDFSPDAWKEKVRRYFSVEEVDSSISAARATGILRNAGHAGTALLAVTQDRAFLVDTPRGIGGDFFVGLSLRQQSLDVVQLHRCVIEGLMGISEEAVREQRNINYVRDAGEALARVREGKANIAFLMNPVRMRQVRDIAFAGEVLPQKSTDFYPKLLSGLTVHALS